MQPGQPKLIIITGAAGAGKSTIAQKYIDEHLLALMVSSDQLVGSMGQWITHELEAQALAFELMTVIAAAHLQNGYDVIVPHLFVRPEEIATLQAIAANNQATFFACAIVVSKQESVDRMLARGTWGEPGSPPITPEDQPIIEDLYDGVQQTLAAYPDMPRITSVANDIEGTYAQLTSQL